MDRRSGRSSRPKLNHLKLKAARVAGAQDRVGSDTLHWNISTERAGKRLRQGPYPHHGQRARCLSAPGHPEHVEPSAHPAPTGHSLLHTHHTTCSTEAKARFRGGHRDSPPMTCAGQLT